MEISECDPREIGSIVDFVSNGRRQGSGCPQRWRPGETGMACDAAVQRRADPGRAHMAEGGRRVKAGQEARLLDVPATTRRYGARRSAPTLTRMAAPSPTP
ncbi:MAG: hypothetical protein U5L11_11710 [Arhodomonas sp.]|nr:hypothetical protein [Arhodomonas sp.]